MSKYYLTHITTKRNLDKIKSNGFITSIHTKNTIQWLGDGVYFWDGNDEKAIKHGKKLVWNKKINKNEVIIKMSAGINVKDINHVNLEDNCCEKHFEKFLKQSCPEGYELITILKMIKNDESVDKHALNHMGMLFGKCMNLYVSMVQEKNIKVDCVSHNFYHKKMKSPLFQKTDLYLRQFCIKNLTIINTISRKKWDIEYI